MHYGDSGMPIGWIQVVGIGRWLLYMEVLVQVVGASGWCKWLVQMTGASGWWRWLEEVAGGSG